MNSNKASPLVPPETDAPQLKTLQPRRPKLVLQGQIFRNAMTNIGNKDIIQAKRDALHKDFITERRKGANSTVIADEKHPSVSTSNTNGQSSQSSIVAPLENCNQKINAKDNHIKNDGIKLINKEHAQGNASNFSGHTKDFYIKEQNANKINNAEKSTKYVNQSTIKSQNEWKGDKKLSNNNIGNLDDTNGTVTECASSYPHSVSISSVQSSSVSKVTKKLNEKEHDADSSFNKSLKDEDSGIGWPEIDLENNIKGSTNIDDGWGPISETDNDSWGTVNPTEASGTSSRSSEKKYDRPNQHRTSLPYTQSMAVSDRAAQNSKGKGNYQRSVSTSFADPAFIEGRTQDFSGKDCRHNSASTSQLASVGGGTKQDFSGRNRTQSSFPTSSVQSAFIQKNIKQRDFNSRERGQEIARDLPKTELEKGKKQDPYGKDINEGEEDEESGWPKLDLDKDRRHSYGDRGAWDDESSVKENIKVSGNRERTYQRSISTPFAQSSKFTNNNNLGASSMNRLHNEDGRGDCSVSLPHSERSQFEKSKYCPPKHQLNRSSSFRDRTNGRDEYNHANKSFIRNGGHANNQDSRCETVDNRNVSYTVGYDTKQNCQTNPLYNEKNFDESRNQGSKMIGSGSSNSNNSATDWKRAWRGNTSSRIEANHETYCSSEPMTPESNHQTIPYREKPNKSDSNLHEEEKCYLEDKDQEIDSADEWSTTSETSEVSIIVLEKDDSKNIEGKRVVVESEMTPTNLTITLNFNDRSKGDDNLGDSKIVENISTNSSVCKEIEDEILPLETYMDPLEDFFTNCSEPVIPPPQPAFANLGPGHNGVALNAVCLDGKKTSESSDCSFTEVDPVAAPASSEVLEDIPDARQIQEITSFLKELEAEKSMPIQISDKILKDVIRVVNYHVKGYFVYLYGSYVSGLAVSTSNLNLALKSDTAVRNSFLLQLQKAFSKGLGGYQVEPFDEDRNAKKSKICFTELKTGITCELGYFGSSVSDHRKMNLLLHEVCQFDSRIKTLLIVTRIWAEVCLIHEPEEGKLHCLGYSLLMLHFLQGLEKPLLPIVDLPLKNWGLNSIEIKNESSVGEMWLAFLKYYSSSFKWEENVVTIHSKTTVLKSSKSWERSFIAIEDPFTQKNIAESVVTYECAEGIFACFKASYQYFSTPVDFEDSESSDSSIAGSQCNSLKKEIFSFNDITFDQTLPTFCEKCDELNEPCGKCRPSKEVILQPLSALSDLSLECVNTALHDVYKDFILPDSKVEGRKAFVRDLESNIKQIYPSAKLTLFGSSVNAFGFKRSDLDICMTLSHKPRSNIEKAAILRNLVRHLRKKPHFYENIFGLYHAKIPIVKFHFIPEDWYCDLSLYNVLAVHNSKLLCKYALFDDRCRILGCAMKLLAKKAGLDDTRCLSSYSNILTVIHYLQQVEPPVLPVLPLDDKKVFDELLEVPKEILDGRNYWLYEDIDKLKKRYLPHPKNVSSVGELWLGLLDFYARYDGTNAVTITQKEPLPSTNLRRCARLLNIEDPFLAKDNLGCILNDTRADQTRKVLGRARLLFGKEIHKDWRHDPKGFFFSSSNLTGQFVKDVECLGCGGFGHEKSDCLKADPFKRSKFRNKFPKPRRHPYIRKV